MAAVALAVSFGLIQRAAQRRRGHYFYVSVTNYAVAALVALVWVAARGGWEASALAYWVGALNGVGFAVLFVLQYFMLGQRGVGVTFALGSLALLAPITVSLVVFSEPAEALTLVGIALLVVAAPLIAYRRMPLLPAARVGLYWAVVVGLLGFNLGVELGQLTVIAAGLLLTIWLRDPDRYRKAVVIPGSLAIAAMGAYWMIQRVFF